MPRLSFLYRTDFHLTDRNPVSWKGDYQEEIWSNLEQVGALAKKYEVNAVLDGGDYFHVKAQSKNPHHLNERTARLHRTYPCPTFCVEGNHDLAFNNLESISKQPLGVLYSAGVFHHLRDQVFEDGGVRVRVVGIPYSPTRSLSEMLQVQKQKGDDILIAVAHTLAAESPPPAVEDFWNEPVFAYEKLVSRNGPDVWMFGHWHKDQGVVSLKGKHFVNQGAGSRGSLVRENLERTPKVSLIEVENGEVSIRQIPLSVAPAAEVFDLERKMIQERERQDINQFVLDLVAQGSVDPEATIETNIEKLDFAEDVRHEALRYLELAEVG